MGRGLDGLREGANDRGVRRPVGRNQNVAVDPGVRLELSLKRLPETHAAAAFRVRLLVEVSRKFDSLLRGFGRPFDNERQKLVGAEARVLGFVRRAVYGLVMTECPGTVKRFDKLFSSSESFSFCNERGLDCRALRPVFGDEGVERLSGLWREVALHYPCALG